MSLVEQYRGLARYNTWMNAKLYALAAELSEEERTRDLGAFFGSLQGTLGHILWADRIWLWRFTKDPEIGISRDYTRSARMISRALMSQIPPGQRHDRPPHQTWVAGLTARRSPDRSPTA
jgi:uncharacterized damage-inducible protein DinB